MMWKSRGVVLFPFHISSRTTTEIVSTHAYIETMSIKCFLYIYVLDNCYFLIFRHTLYLSEFNNKGLGDSAIPEGRQLAICKTAPVYFLAFISRHPRYIAESSVLSSKARAEKKCVSLHSYLINLCFSYERVNLF